MANKAREEILEMRETPQGEDTHRRPQPPTKVLANILSNHSDESMHELTEKFEGPVKRQRKS